MQPNTIQQGFYIQLHYDILAEDGFLLGSTRDSGEALAFIPGVMETDPPALGTNLIGKPLDYSGTIVLEPEQAYGVGLPEEDSLATVDKSSFPPDFPLDKGMMFEAEVPGQGIIPGMIMGVQDDQVLVRYGHPLAGQTIVFQVEVLEARPATEEDVKRLHALYSGE